MCASSPSGFDVFGASSPPRPDAACIRLAVAGGAGDRLTADGIEAMAAAVRRVIVDAPVVQPQWPVR